MKQCDWRSPVGKHEVVETVCPNGAVPDYLWFAVGPKLTAQLWAEIAPVAIDAFIWPRPFEDGDIEFEQERFSPLIKDWWLLRPNFLKHHTMAAFETRYGVCVCHNYGQTVMLE